MDTLLTASDIVLRLGMATFFGMLLGLDRQLRGKPAGLRTHMLIALGAAATTLVALGIYQSLIAHNPQASVDPLRVIPGVMAAIGFLGAGSIIVSGRQVRHLTTAANIWLCGAIGLTCGAGDYLLALIVFGFTALILTGVAFVERWWLPRGED